MNSNILSGVGVSDASFQALDQVATLLGLVMGSTWLIGLLLACFKPDSLRRWFTRNRFPSIGGRPEIDWQGVVFTVSRAEVPLWVIGQVQPRMLGLLLTSFSEGEAAKIEAEAKQRGITVFTDKVSNPDDPAEVNQKTKTLLRAMQEEDIQPIAVDITGGKTPMSVGAFMAAEEVGCDTIYVTTDNKNGKPDMSTASIIAISQTAG